MSHDRIKTITQNRQRSLVEGSDFILGQLLIHLHRGRILAYLLNSEALILLTVRTSGLRICQRLNGSGRWAKGGEAGGVSDDWTFGERLVYAARVSVLGIGFDNNRQ